MCFIRFVLARRHPDSGVEDGAFGLAYELRHAWFKDTATEHLARMHQIKGILERYGHSVVMLSETRVGYVVYDDAYQVVAEPFTDTQTG
jgi:hypothetical protein